MGVELGKIRWGVRPDDPERRLSVLGHQEDEGLGEEQVRPAGTAPAEAGRERCAAREQRRPGDALGGDAAPRAQGQALRAAQAGAQGSPPGLREARLSDPRHQGAWSGAVDPEDAQQARVQTKLPQGDPPAAALAQRRRQRRRDGHTHYAERRRRGGGGLKDARGLLGAEAHEPIERVRGEAVGAPGLGA